MKKENWFEIRDADYNVIAKFEYNYNYIGWMNN